MVIAFINSYILIVSLYFYTKEMPKIKNASPGTGQKSSCKKAKIIQNDFDI